MAGDTHNPDRHKTRTGVFARLTPELRGSAQSILEANGWTMNDFLLACLMLLARNPQPFLARLDQVLPGRSRSRPKPRS